MRRQKKTARQRQKRNRYLLLSAGAGGLTLLLVAAVFLLSSRPAALAVDENSGDLVAQGRQVYDAQCATCHGANLEGEDGWQEPAANGLLKAPPHDETGHTWHHDDAYLIESVQKGGVRLSANLGISPMPAYENILTEAEIVAALAYIKSTWPPDILAAQSGR
jgi:mono/diheme cytochrome c family protein